MKIQEVVEINEEINVRKLLAKVAIGASFLGVAGGIAGIGKAVQNKETSYNQKKAAQHYTADPELTKIGRDILKTLPTPIVKKLGNIETIDFVKGVPEDGDPNAVCQTDMVDRAIFVNPKYVERFEQDASEQLTAHEATHIAQREMKHKVPATDEKSPYGKMTSPDAWKILADLRKNGDRMWDHSREEQGMIVQQREAANTTIKNLSQYPQSKERDAQLAAAKQKIAVFDQYIGDYDQDK